MQPYLNTQELERNEFEARILTVNCKSILMINASNDSRIILIFDMFSLRCRNYVWRWQMSRFEPKSSLSLVQAAQLRREYNMVLENGWWITHSALRQLFF